MNNTSLQLISKITNINKKYLLGYIALCFSAVLIAFYGIIWSESFRKMVNGAVNSNYNELKQGIILAIVVFSIDSITQFYSLYLNGKLDNASILNLQKLVMNKLVRSEYGIIIKKSCSYYSNVVNDFIPEVQQTLVKKFRDMIGIIVTVILTFSYLVTIDFKLSVGLLILSTLLPFSANLFSKTIKNRCKFIQDKNLEKQAFIQDVVQAPIEVRVFGLQKYFEEKLKSINQVLFKKIKKLFVLENGVNQINILSNYACIFYIVGYGGYLTYSGEINIGEIVAFFYASFRIFNPLPAILSLWVNIQSSLVKLKEIFFILELPQEKKVQSLKLKNINIKFDNVNFEYDVAYPILKNVSFEICKHEITTIVGENGAGKSTIIKLIMQLYKPCSGKILFNDKDICEFDVRNLISYVPQNSYIFSGTIKENILINNIDIPTKRLDRITRLALLENFIKNRETGYESILLEYGKNISGGEKQRINIARALMKDAPIFILDEPTSAIDNFNEKEIFSKIKQIAKEKTVIIVAHKINTIINSNKIIFLKNGNVKEVGSFKELMSNKKDFYNYYKEVIC